MSLCRVEKRVCNFSHWDFWRLWWEKFSVSFPRGSHWVKRVIFRNPYENAFPLLISVTTSCHSHFSSCFSNYTYICMYLCSTITQPLTRVRLKKAWKRENFSRIRIRFKSESWAISNFSISAENSWIWFNYLVILLSYTLSTFLISSSSYFSFRTLRNLNWRWEGTEKFKISHAQKIQKWLSFRRF